MKEKEIYDILSSQYTWKETTDMLLDLFRKTKIYILKESYDMYEDYREIFVGVFSDRDEMLKRAREIASRYDIKTTDYPMSEDEFYRCNGGARDEDTYPEDFDSLPLAERMRITSEKTDRDGHTKDEFEQMQDMLDRKAMMFNFCKAEVATIDGGGLDETIYVYADGHEETVCPGNTPNHIPENVRSELTRW